ncbi:MAG TPA: winged helix-turn-helix domain-containing protein [Vicinamibacterales bacterium]|nr:winged helix-turn-helix domain-containing protein [Vicinamibacterales bacterium]
MATVQQSKIVSFGPYRVDLRSGELYKGGVRIVLQGQSFRLLEGLLERPGEVLGRDELRARLWPSDTYVDFEHSINAAVRRLRRALGDSADAPRYIETLPRRGYRFVGAVPTVIGPAEAGAYVREGPGSAPSARMRLAVLPFSAIASHAEPDEFTEGLTEETIAQITNRCAPAIGVVSRLAVGQLQYARGPIETVRDALQVDYVVEGRVRHAQTRVRITIQLIDAADATHIWADAYERDCVDDLSVQKDVAQSIAEAVASRLLGFDYTSPQ